MTNLEWLLSLPVEEIKKRYYGDECTRCIYENSRECDNRWCAEGTLKWLSKERVPEIKPCPVCKGKMNTRWWGHGCYLVCEDCGIHFGIDTDKAEQGIIEGDYEEEVALIDDWNRRVNNGN